MRAAVLLVNDLGVLILRHRIAEVLGIDPLSTTGTERWATEVLTICRNGLGTINPENGGNDVPDRLLTSAISAVGARILRSRTLVRAPIWICRARLGSTIRVPDAPARVHGPGRSSNLTTS